MGCLKKIGWSSSALWETTLVILGIDLISSVFHPSYRQHTSYSSSIDNGTSTNVSSVEALVRFTMIPTVFILDTIVGIVGMVGFVAERPIYLRVYVMICHINLARFSITILVLCLSWLYHYDFSKYESNLLMLLDSSLFLDQFNILEKFRLGGSQVFVCCIIIFQLFMCRWLTACVVYSYYLKLLKKMERQDVYSITQPLTAPVMDGIDTSRNHQPDGLCRWLCKQPEYASPADPPPVYTEEWN